MGVERARQGDAVGVVLEHANRQRLDAARNEEAIHGRQACARGTLDKIDFLGIFWTCKHYRSAGGIAVAIQVFRHGMNNDVRAKLDGPLQIGAQKCIVDGHCKVALVGQLGNRGNISDAHGGVRRSLDVEHFCIGTQSIADEIWHGGVHKAEFQAKVDEELRGKAENTSVNRFGQNDMELDRKSTRLNSSHQIISYAVFCLKKKKKVQVNNTR